MLAGRDRRAARRIGSVVLVSLALYLMGADPGRATHYPADALAALTGNGLDSRAAPFKICSDQTYALCATAKCFVFNQVAYCRCDIKHGDSISLAFNYAPGKNVCTANAEGVANGYMISTFSPPRSVAKPGGNMALYDCPASTSNGAYAQCDGGYCFKSTRGERFPGFAQRLDPNEIICSCPLTVPDPATAKIGFQIAGPFPCQRDFFRNCKNPPAGTSTGSTIYVGAPTGTATFLTRKLTGSVPPLNRCLPPPDLAN